MEHFDKLMSLIENEIEAINRNGKFKSREEIDSVYKLVDIAKDIECMNRWEEEMDGESYDGGMSYARSRRGSYNDGSYDDGMSYARGRGRNARRDSMGRYSRESYRGSYERGYSRDGKEEYKEQLMDMMENAPSEEVRQSIKRMLDQM